MEGLYQKLESQGLKNVVYMVVNHQGEAAQRLHAMLAEKLSANITLYKQDEQQPDVWQTLGGEKDDFFIYDRCGRLTHHISLPYTIIGLGHVEGAIKDTYCKRICGECTHESVEIPEECKPQSDGERPTPAEEDTGHGHHHGHGHGHGHGHHRGNHGSHPHGFGHGRDHNHGHHHGSHDGHGHGHGHGQSQSQQGVSQHGQEQDGSVSQGQHDLDLGQMQQAAHIHQMPQEAAGAPVSI